MLRIVDEIRVAWAEWIIKYHIEPTQVILPRSTFERLGKYAAQYDLIDRSKCPHVFSRRIEFHGMKVYFYDGDDIVFSREKEK